MGKDYSCGKKTAALEKWREHCKKHTNSTPWASTKVRRLSEKDRRIRRMQNNYADFCEYYFPHFFTFER